MKCYSWQCSNCFYADKDIIIGTQRPDKIKKCPICSNSMYAYELGDEFKPVIGMEK
jgi:C4-type Zn-finger protein